MKQFLQRVLPRLRVAAGALLSLFRAKRPERSARAAMAGVSRRTSVLFPQDFSLVQNPYKGWVVDGRNTSVAQPHTMAYAAFSWRDVESKKGIYNFDAFEAAYCFSHWRAQNVKLVLRLYLDYPRSTPHRDIPDWLYAEMGGRGTAYANSYGRGFSPDYTHATLVKAHEKLLRAIAARYDGDPAVAFVELGSVGHWGEWHTGQNNGVKIPFPSQAVCDKLAGHYVQAFHNKILMMRRPTRVAAANKMGLFNDSFGDVYQTETYFIRWFNNGYQDSQTGAAQPAMKDFWKFAPSGGEVANYPGEQYFTDEAIARTIAQLEASHTSWLGPSGPYLSADPELRGNMDLLLSRMGYRFHVSAAELDSAARPGGTFSAAVTMANAGVAPFYYPWPVNLYLLDGGGTVRLTQKSRLDLRTLLPGETAKLEFSIAVPRSFSGVYRVCLGIADPATGQPAVRLANAGAPALLQLGTIPV